MFGVTLGDPLRYDIVLNTGRVAVESCIEQVIALSRRPEFQPTPASAAQLAGLAMQARIRAALLANPDTAEVNVAADVQGGAVALRGIVMKPEERTRAAEVVATVSGVKSVDNQLRVMEFGTRRFTGSKHQI